MLIEPITTVMSAVMVVNQVDREPGPAAAGLVVIGCGVPIYFLLRRRSTSLE
jgi:hypothetical protein